MLTQRLSCSVLVKGRTRLSVTTALDRLVAGMRDADWLTVERSRAWCRVLAVITALMVMAWIVTSHGGLDLWGKPLGADFVSFWTASRLAIDGHAALAYDPIAHVALQRSLFPTVHSGYYAFFYPPVFLFICFPLALLPFFPALIVWLSASFAVLFVCLRRILAQRWAILPIVAFPGVLINAGHGQNGFLSAACLGWNMLLLQRRPFISGLCLGALIYKPHLLLGAPIALLAARRWKVVAGAATSSMGLIVISWIVLGEDSWGGFLHASKLARETLEQGLVEPWKMQSAFAAVRLLHGSVMLAYVVQVPVTLAACALLGWIVAHRPGAPAEGALMVVATLLSTPFLLSYDLVCLALPIAWITAEAQLTAWYPWEKTVLLAAYVLPLISLVVGQAGIPIAPVVLASLLVVVARRAAGIGPVG